MKNKFFHRVAIATIIALMALPFFGLQSAWADDGATTAMFVSPMIQKLLLTPGEQYSGTITVSNNSNATMDLTYGAEVGSYGWSRSEESKDDYGGLDVDSKTEFNLVTDWITLDKASGTIAPGAHDEIVFTIDVPESAPVGAQYASILITDNTDRSNGEQSGDGININSVSRIASAIMINVTGATTEKGTIVENSFPSLLLSNTFEAVSIVKNEGNVYTDAEYTLQVWPMGSDEEVCTNEEDAEDSFVLPNTERYHTQTCALPAIGFYRAKQVVKIFGETSELEKTIFYCPLWVLFIIVLAVAAIITWIVMRSKSRKK